MKGKETEIITVECSLCPQTFTDKVKDMHKRCNAHERGRHQRHTTVSERDGHVLSTNHGMGNLIFGKVEWYTVGDKNEFKKRTD